MSQMQKRVWLYSGDVDVLGYGGTFLRHVADRRYHAIRFDNMDEACGSDNEGQDTYYGSLVEVDLNEADTQAAAQSWGMEDEDNDDVTLAFMVASYGEYAPLQNESGNNGHAIIRSLKRESRELEADPEAYEAAMSRPVNALGATAREFQRGDMDSAMDRALAPRPCEFGVLSPDGTMSGQVSIDMAQTGSPDPIAFAYGFSHGQRGQPLEVAPKREELAPEYVRGHAEGLKVFEGAELPSFANR